MSTNLADVTTGSRPDREGPEALRTQLLASSIAVLVLIVIIAIVDIADSYSDAVLLAVGLNAAATGSGTPATYQPDFSEFWFMLGFIGLYLAFVVFCVSRVITRRARWAMWTLAVFAVLETLGLILSATDGDYDAKAIFLGLGAILAVGGIFDADKKMKQAAASPGPEAAVAHADPAPASPQAAGGQHSLSDEDIVRMEKLRTLHASGILTDAEFDAQKQLILSGR